MSMLNLLKKAGLYKEDNKKLNTARLRNDIQTKLSTWDECSSFTLAGVTNLSRSDLNTLMMCCDFYDKYGDLSSFRYFGKEISAVLDKYSI